MAVRKIEIIAFGKIVIILNHKGLRKKSTLIKQSVNARRKVRWYNGSIRGRKKLYIRIGDIYGNWCNKGCSRTIKSNKD